MALTIVTEGAAPVIAPDFVVGNTSCDMNTSHTIEVLVLGSAVWLPPYHTASARPAPPALIHGKTLTIEGAWLTCTGGVQVRQPLEADAALT